MTPPADPRINTSRLADVRAWCGEERSWFVRIPVWLYLAYVGVEQFLHPDTY